MSQSLFNIALLGMNSRNTSTFSYFIKKHAGHFFQVSTADNANSCIVDFDIEGGIKLWHRHGFNSKPSIILSSIDPKKTQAIWVKKPVNAADMKTAVSDLLKLINSPKDIQAKTAEETLTTIEAPKAANDANTAEATTSDKKTRGYQSDFSDAHSPSLNLSKQSVIECCGSQIDGDWRSPLFQQQMSFNPKQSLLMPLQKALRLAREKNTVVELQGLRTSFVIMPGGEQIFVDLGSHLIRHICAMAMQMQPTIKAVPMSLIQCDQLYPKNHRNMHHRNTVLWQVALWSSRGRLPKQVLPTDALAIKAWPNFTRLTITPFAIAMASVWVKHSLSPVEIAQQMQIPQRYVFAFVAALHAVELTEQEQAKEKPAALDWRKPQGLLNSILRSLKVA